VRNLPDPAPEAEVLEQIVRIVDALMRPLDPSELSTLQDCGGEFELAKLRDHERLQEEEWPMRVQADNFSMLRQIPKCLDALESDGDERSLMLLGRLVEHLIAVRHDDV